MSMYGCKGSNRDKPFCAKWLVLLCAVWFFGATQPARAAVGITPASGGSAISADTAASGGAGTWTTLGPITIAEGKKTDISAGSGVTLVLKAPSGFEFNTSSTPSISFTPGADITAATIAVSDSSTLSVTMDVSGAGFNDSIIIGTT